VLSRACARRAGATRRARPSGPISGTVAPVAASRRARAGVGAWVSAPVTSAVIARALAAEKVTTTLRQPCRSASRPTSGSQATWPSARAPPVSPAAVREPLVRATSSTLPNWTVAVGSRARKDSTGSRGLVRPMTSR